jgi:cytoskeleton protein RodZ
LRLNIPGTFGEKLQRERELRSITLDEIAASTKIGTRLLHALETEEFEKLPGGIFNKGFVRAYAKYLGLDEEQAVTDYVAAENEKERKRRAPLDPEQPRSSPPQLFAIQGGARPDNVYNIRASAEIVPPQPDQAGSFLKAAVILVFVLGIGGFGWKYYGSRTAAPKTVTLTDTQPQKASPVHEPPQQVATDIPDTSSAATLPASAAVTGSTPQPIAADKPADVKPSDIASKDPETATKATPGAIAKPAVVPAEFTLDLRADEDSWAQITADGRPLWSGIVSKDGSKSFRAAKELVIKLGNAPGVQLSYNGKPLPRFSQDSKTRTLIFTPEGLSPR